MMNNNRIIKLIQSKKHLIIAAFQSQPLFYGFLSIIIIFGAWLRLYNLESTLMFLGDQGRDALIVARIFREFDPAFIGPVTSVGNMYLGPFYYYFMLPFLMFSYPSPIGPAVGVALVNIITIFLMYYWGQAFVGKKAALWASFFFAFSNIAITYARFSWNPNLSAFFSLLVLYLSLKAHQSSSKYYLGLALAAGLLIQLHYVNLILIPVIGIFWLKKAFLTHREEKAKLKLFYTHSFLALLIFGLTLVPLALFDWKYDWRNTQAAFSIFSQESSFYPQGIDKSFIQVIIQTLIKIPGRLTHLFTTLFIPNLDIYSLRVAFGVMIFVTTIYFTLIKPAKKYKNSLQLLGLSSIISLFALVFYNHSVFDHYILFFLPIIFLLFGYLISLISTKKSYIIICFALVIFYFFGNYRSNYYYPMTPQLTDLDRITNVLLDQLQENETFNFVLIDNNRDLLGDHYRYYFSTKTTQLLPMENFYDADVFFVIDETLEANLYEQESYQIVIFRNYPDATLSAIPYDGGPLLYKFVRTEGSNEKI